MAASPPSAAPGPAADARKRRRRPPPMAFREIAVQRVDVIAGAGGRFYQWTYRAQLQGWPPASLPGA